MPDKPITQRGLALEFFQQHPNRDIPTEEAVDWLDAEYKRRTNKKLRDPDRAIRNLAQDGSLIKVKKGVYRYDPDAVYAFERNEFTEQQKAAIMKSGGNKCAMCGLGEREGVELHIDHKRPRRSGGKAELENGQVLCAKHNNLKKKFGANEVYKSLFVNLRALAKKENEGYLVRFCDDILKTYESHDIDSHIKWKR